MSRNCIKLGKLTCLSVAISALAWANAAAAQTTGAAQPQDSAGTSEAQGSGEIIVTARKRSESLQEVPASITAFVETDLKTANIVRPADFIGLTPGVSQVQTVEVGDFQVNIRGINSGRDTESSVALIIDGVLVTNPNAINQELDNITQIEVLKGPQGALYGRNALAGAIIMTTRKPTDELTAFVKGGAGKYGLWSISGGVAGPIGSGVKAAINAYHKQEDGSFTNTFRDCDDCENFLKETGVTGRLIFEPATRSSWTSRRAIRRSRPAA